jgi:CRISPR-associated endonuclease/helicase Cas3
MSTTAFANLFKTLTETSPFPWQRSLYESFIEGKIPSAIDLPTGLGKTSVVVIWLIALITHPEKMPRRLVYVVNRRTVVDQTTAEVERLRGRLNKSPDLLTELKERCAMPFDSPLALSTLRGQFADNREWCADPARPAVIVGTVDMIGSGLLFCRYTCGFKTRPHHAALLGQDALLIHDEAHLEPAFQKLLVDIVAEQKRCKDARPLRVLELSATKRETGSSFSLTPQDEKDQRVIRRLLASKRLVLRTIDDEKQLAENLTTLALARRDSGRAVLIFARFVEVVQRVAEALEKQKLGTVVLTGTMRGKERDELAQQNPRFLRFLPKSSRPDDSPETTEGTVYLVATSAGEVGVNISADDLICDLSTYESLAQRFGRVNRFGDTPDTTIDLVHPTSFDESDPRESARARTLELLRQLAGDASPDALRKLDPAARIAAFSPLPEMRPTTDILFDAWALTSIRDILPGRPPVAPYLHGEPPEWEQPETHVAWRREVDEITGVLLDYYPPRELLEDYPLKPHELLRDRSSRVREQLAHMADRFAKKSPGGNEPQMWLIDDDDRVELKPLSFFANKDSESRLHGRTVLLPPSLGGLSPSGLLDGKAESAGGGSEDVADVQKVRQRTFHSSQGIPDDYSHLRLVRVIDLRRNEEESEDNDASDENRYWLWLEASAASDTGSIRKAGKSVLLEDHTRDVEGHASAIVQKLSLPELLAHCVVLAARFHDLGKSRRYWQRGIGNEDPKLCLAKAGRELRPRTLDEPYRHEFGSLRDAELEAEFQKIDPDERDLVLHLIASHHGRARPHFPIEEAFDPDGTPVDSEAIATEVPRRFGRLQRQFGRWGLAYLESLLRAADYAASAGISPTKKAKP